MTNTKMLQILVDGQVSIRKEIKSLDKKLNKKIDKLDKRLTKRLDMIGASVAFLEDDAPTVKQFNKLEKRVTKTEHQISSL